MPGSAAGIMKVSERIRCASADAGTSQMTNRQVTTTKRRTGFPLRQTVIEFLAPAMVICRRTTRRIRAGVDHLSWAGRAIIACTIVHVWEHVIHFSATSANLLALYFQRKLQP